MGVCVSPCVFNGCHVRWSRQEIKTNGFELPGFEPLTYLSTPRRPHGTGVGAGRRLGRIADDVDKAVEEADKKWVTWRF